MVIYGIKIKIKGINAHRGMPMYNKYSFQFIYNKKNDNLKMLLSYPSQRHASFVQEKKKGIAPC